MSLSLDVEKQIPDKTEPKSPADYQDLDFAELQRITDYITKHSVPHNMTVQAIQRVISSYSDLLNTTLYNLNLLRNLAGHDPFEIPGIGGDDNG